jgi:hypothetical protein
MRATPSTRKRIQWSRIAPVGALGTRLLFEVLFAIIVRACRLISWIGAKIEWPRSGRKDFDLKKGLVKTGWAWPTSVWRLLDVGLRAKPPRPRIQAPGAVRTRPVHQAPSGCRPCCIVVSARASCSERKVVSVSKRHSPPAVATWNRLTKSLSRAPLRYAYRSIARALLLDAPSPGAQPALGLSPLN